MVKFPNSFPRVREWFKANPGQGLHVDIEAVRENGPEFFEILEKFVRLGEFVLVRPVDEWLLHASVLRAHGHKRLRKKRVKCLGMPRPLGWTLFHPFRSTDAAPPRVDADLRDLYHSIEIVDAAPKHASYNPAVQQLTRKTEKLPRKRKKIALAQLRANFHMEDHEKIRNRWQFLTLQILSSFKKLEKEKMKKLSYGRVSDRSA